MAKSLELNAFDKFTRLFAPLWTMKRVAARASLRHYEAAQFGRRTSNWKRSFADANGNVAIALTQLRVLARDLVRNNAWAKRGLNVIANNTVGWGLVPKAIGSDSKAIGALWKKWADSTECDADGQRTFYALQHQAMKALAQDGEVLIRRRRRKASDELAVPLQLQILEADFLDTSKTGTTYGGGKIVNGIELDGIGRRAAYWLFQSHPGSSTEAGSESKRIPASEIAHLYAIDRPGQMRGISWFAPAIINLKELDEYEDAELMKQKIAASFSAFVTDPSGVSSPVGQMVNDDGTIATPPQDTGIEQLEPGLVSYLPPGKEITFATPPQTVNGEFTQRVLRRIAAGLGVTYEDLTGDYSNVNFSSARMARIAHWANVHNWQFHIIVPMMCNPIWSWFMEAAVLAGSVKVATGAEWTAPPMPMLEPDKEGLAIMRLVRTGVKTFSEALREQGLDPEAFFEEYASDLETLKKLGIKLDSDASAMSQAGQAQITPGEQGKATQKPADPISDSTEPDEEARDLVSLVKLVLNEQ